MLMITEDYVSFETAKLLKEKGFDFCCEFQYINCLSGYPFLTDIHDDAGCYYKNSEIGQDEYSAPTLQMAMKWLRLIHKIHIQAFAPVYDMDCAELGVTYNVIITNLVNQCLAFDTPLDNIEYSSPEQACEAAIKYCLKYLI